MDKFKNDLFKDLEELTPQMSDSLKEFPITVKEKKPFFSTLQFKILTPVISLVVLTIILLSIFLKPNTPDDPIITSHVYLIEVNPSFVMVTDENGNLAQLKSGNSDADEVLLSIDIEGLVGKNVDTAIEALADELLQLGYFNDVENNVMKISTDSKNEEVTNKFNNYFCEKGYFVAVLEEELNYEEFNTKFNSNVNDFDSLLSHINEMEELQIESNDFENVDIEEEYIDNYLKEEIADSLVESGMFSQEFVDYYLSRFDEYINYEDLLNKIDEIINYISIFYPDLAEKLEKYTNIEVPETKEEFVDTIKDIYKSKVEEKKENNKEVYEEKKEAISPDEYEKYIEDIKEKYGDIKNFWENKQQNSDKKNEKGTRK